ncbi:DUF998 domain-containing protein [Rhizohabitans arisaemae]|uniref:DUF998 domain-containing protein n=1 Tax=Rhizohabitans arisaemae TaxID=2720610 RepID=UPI0024B1D8DF|nr:DUF998 domain-containing protein [Rhizohabitans arisaemae]
MSTRALLRCGAFGPPLFYAVLLIEGALRPGYDPVYHSGSHLALGGRGWIQIVNFILLGLLLVAFAVGVRRVLDSRWIALFIGLVGFGLIVSGVFVMDPMQGYPPGAPAGIPAETSVSHLLHDLGALPVFLGLPAACVAAAVRFPGGWRLYSVATAVASSALFIWYGQVFTADLPYAGLVQRVLVGVNWLWLTLLAVDLLRDRARRPADSAPSR